MINKIYTENPLLDELVYAMKIMMTSCVLKDQQLADSYETLDSLKNAEILFAIKENRAKLNMFEIEDWHLLKIGIPNNDVLFYLENINLLPEDYSNELLKLLSHNFLENYDEKNQYYKELNGKPTSYNQYIAYSDLDIPESDSIDQSNTYKLLHEMSDDFISLLYSNGTIDKLKKKFGYKYLNFLGSRRIDIYRARKAIQFEVLYIQNPDNIDLYERYKELLEISRVYIYKTVYNEAFAIGSDKYNAFISMLIIIQASIDFISELPEYIVRRDFFDLRTIQYFFESNGVDFYQDIPLKYQIALVKNLNTLIKYSGTNKCLVDIASLFGFDNIELFTYYMLKERKKDSNGDYITITNSDGDIDYEKTYDLKFIKVPIDGNLNDYLKNKNNHYDYSYITEADKSWNNKQNALDVKRNILEQEFNTIRSKYISIDSTIELTDLAFQLPYFINMVTFSKIDLSKLKIVVAQLSENPIELTDLIVTLFSLTYQYFGIDDTIIDSQTKYLTVKGFNFQANIQELINYIYSNNISLDDIGIAGFDIPKDGVLTFSQLVSIYLNNKSIHEHLSKQMKNAPNKKIFDIYNKIYQSLMYCELSFDHFYIDELDSIASTYTEYQKYKNPDIYNYLIDLSNEQDIIVRNKKISSMIYDIVTRIHNHISHSELSKIFANIPTMDMDFIRIYMSKVMNFFKSYEVEILITSNIYKFADPIDNMVFVLDYLKIDHYHNLKDIISILESVDLDITTSLKDFLNIDDNMILKSYVNDLREFIDNYKIQDCIEKHISLSMDDRIFLIDTIYNILITLTKIDYISPYDTLKFNINRVMREKIAIDEIIEFSYIRR